jgi:hypothetical protein
MPGLALGVIIIRGGQSDFADVEPHGYVTGHRTRASLCGDAFTLAQSHDSEGLAA